MARDFELELLDRVLLGQLKFVGEELRLLYYNRNLKRFHEKKVQYHNKTGRAKFHFAVGKASLGNRKTITVYRNRLIWMFYNREAIPDGYVIDHKDGDRCNDAPSNLTLMSELESNSQGFDKQTAPAFEEVSRYFDHIAFTGETPNWG